MNSRHSLPSGTDYALLLKSLRLQQPWASVSLDQPTTAPAASAGIVEAAAQWSALPQLVRARAKTEGDRIALADGRRLLSYRELDVESDRLAGVLRANGIRPADMVALVVDRGIAFVIAVLAVWKLRAAFLPMRPHHPAAWRADIAARAGARLGLAIEGQEAVPGLGQVDIDGADMGDPVEERTTRPDDLAYMIYTSGSTGEPKLVMTDHRGLGNFVSALSATLAGVGPDMRVAQFSDPTFDGSMFDLLLALGHGGRLEFPGPSVTSGDPLARFFTERHITHALLPAAVTRTLEPGTFPSLVSLLTGGDVCHPETAARWSGFHHQFINAYGPTETTIIATMHVASPADADRRTVPIGRELPGYHVMFLDDRRNPVPDGAIGEICIGGAGLARGYHNANELTADRFVTVTGERVYRTGDLGRRSPDGSVEFLGRLDSQVKIRGMRVELGQVEAALAEVRGVREAAAKKVEESLVGYVIAEDDSKLSAVTVRNALVELLPRHLVPDSVQQLEEWPLNSNGKVDRERLPKPAHLVVARHTEPDNDVEALIARIVADVLGFDSVSIDDDFSGLGAHSLAITQIAARVRIELGRDVSAREMMSGSMTVRLLAEIAARHPVVPVSGPVAGQGHDPVPSYAQRRAWMMSELDPQALAYNTQSVIRLKGPLELDALEASLTDIVRRHDVLRSRFLYRRGELQVELIPPWRVELPAIDHSGAPRHELDRLLAQTVHEFVRIPFQLGGDPLARWLLVRLAVDEHVLVHVEHHAVHDGWSYNLFLNELFTGYQRFRRDGEVRRPVPAASYYDYAHWERQWCETEAAQRQREFWREALTGARTVLELPRRQLPGRRRFNGRAPRLNIDGSLARDLEDLSRREGTSLFMTMLAAFFAMLHRYTGADDVLVASAPANRAWRSTEDLLGMFVNTVVLRSRSSTDTTFRDLLARVRETCLAAYDNQQLPFEMVVEEADPLRLPGINPLVQAAFNFHDSRLRSFPGLPLEITSLEGLSNGSVKFDLNLIVVPRQAEPGHIGRLPGDVLVVPASDEEVRPSAGSPLDGITIMWEFDTDALEESLVHDMMASYHQLLRGIVSDTATPVSRLPIMTGERHADVLAMGQGEIRAMPEICLDELIDRQADRTPDSVAVISESETVSYRSLVDRADRLADLLAREGAGRGDVIAIRLPSSADFIVAALAVLKCGAAYLPLDPSHPPARSDLLITDSGARFVIDDTFADDGDPAVHAKEERSPRDAAYILYTSGSTGVPKGVVIPHRAAVARLGVPDLFGLGPGKLLVQTTSTIFDVWGLEVFGSLVRGATVLVPSAARDAAQLGRLIARSGATHVISVPARLREVIAAVPDAFDRVERVISGGDVLSPDLVRLLSRRGVTAVTNTYGPTEATILATEHTTYGTDEKDPTVPVGKPVANTHVMVVDACLQLVPPNVTGEICIGGQGLARGYLGRPDRTAATFIPDPFTAEHGLLYRTGDLGRWLPNGELDFVGRRDGQVKVRGVRIELGEVQAAMTALADVADAIVTTDRDRLDDKRLVAYVIPAQGSAPSETGIREALREVLPSQLVPSIVMILNTWPFTDAGKVDRSRLPAPAVRSGNDYLAPRGPVEAMIASIIAELLGIDKVGVHDDFFQLGGHSLLATRLAAEITSRTNIPVGLTDVFAHPTVAGLSAMEAAETSAPIPRLPRDRGAMT